MSMYDYKNNRMSTWGVLFLYLVTPYGLKSIRLVLSHFYVKNWSET